jgi:hypothetical protein
MSLRSPSHRKAALGMESRSAWRIHPVRAAFPRFAARWDAANARLYRQHPLLSSAFVMPLVQHFATAGDLLAEHVDDAGDSFVLCSRRQPLRWSSFQPAQAQITPALIASAAAAIKLPRSLPGLSVAFELYNQDPSFSCFDDTNIPVTAEFTSHALTTSIDIGLGFEQYWESRSPKLRQNIKRYLRRAEADGAPARLVKIADFDGLLSGLARYGEIESLGWKGQAGTAVHADNAQGHFYRDVLTGFAATDNAAIFELYLGDTLAASRIAISNDEMLVMLKTTYVEELSRYAPGRILLYLLLEHIFARGTRRWIEFYTSATPDLVTWATHTRTIRHVTLYRSALMKMAFEHYRRLRFDPLRRVSP